MKNRYEIIKDEKTIKSFIFNVLESASKEIMDYKAGKEESLDILVGKVFKESKGKADPKVIRRILKKILNSNKATKD
jgi:aspartyl-tRNA(Asn)/glutamyl-tRNA(Gln) amidotransferase subunit B